MLDIQGAIRLLDDWGRWSCPLPGNGFAACRYMTPEERIQAGATSRPSSVNEDEVMRAEAVIATLPESTRLLLRKHYVFKANPKRVCEQLRLPCVDYRAYVTRAEEVFRMKWNYLLSTPTKSIRYLSLNNSPSLRHVSTRERVVSHA